MDKEMTKIFAAAGVGFFVGMCYEDYKIIKKRRAVAKKFNERRDDDFWKMITKFLNDPTDNRTPWQLVNDWQTNIKFHKIVNEQD